MGFAREGVWFMGYCGPMGYGVHFPAHQVGGRPRLCVKRGYGLPEVWVKRGSTVYPYRGLSNPRVGKFTDRVWIIPGCIHDSP